MILQIMTPFSTDYIKTSAITAISTFKNHVGTQTLEINIQDRTDGYARVEDPVFFTAEVCYADNKVCEVDFEMIEPDIAIDYILNGDTRIYVCSRADLVEVRSALSNLLLGT